MALLLRIANGLGMAEIARAYLVPDTTVVHFITCTKRTLKAARVPLELTQAADRTERLALVREAIYLVFKEDYAATAGGVLIAYRPLLRPAVRAPQAGKRPTGRDRGAIQWLVAGASDPGRRIESCRRHRHGL